jgi:hypothetical protein
MALVRVRENSEGGRMVSVQDRLWSEQTRYTNVPNYEYPTDGFDVVPLYEHVTAHGTAEFTQINDYEHKRKLYYVCLDGSCAMYKDRAEADKRYAIMSVRMRSFE